MLALYSADGVHVRAVPGQGAQAPFARPAVWRRGRIHGFLGQGRVGGRLGRRGTSLFPPCAYINLASLGLVPCTPPLLPLFVFDSSSSTPYHNMFRRTRLSNHTSHPSFRGSSVLIPYLLSSLHFSLYFTHSLVSRLPSPLQCMHPSMMPAPATYSRRLRDTRMTGRGVGRGGGAPPGLQGRRVRVPVRHAWSTRSGVRQR